MFGGPDHTHRALVVRPFLPIPNRFYEVTLKPRVRDTANGTTAPGYVRGEEVLGAWRPRSASLVAEHRSQLHRMYTTADVERTRQFLQLRKEVRHAGWEAVGRTVRGREVAEVCATWSEPPRPPFPFLRPRAAARTGGGGCARDRERRRRGRRS